jgi:hypothetical protein
MPDGGPPCRPQAAQRSECRAGFLFRGCLRRALEKPIVKGREDEAVALCGALRPLGQ